MAALNNKIDALIFARILGAKAAGNYYVGVQLAELPTSELAFPISRAIYPSLSELQDDKARVREAYLQGVAALGAIAMPAAVGFALVAHLATPILLGDQWSRAIPVIQVLTPVMGVQTLLLATQYYAMALGRTRAVFVRELMFFLIRTPIVIWTALNFGLKGAIYAVAACGIIHITLNLALYARLAGRNPLEPFWSARRSFAGVAAMATGLTLTGDFIDRALPDWLALAVSVGFGGAIYVAVQFALWMLEGKPDGVERAVATRAARLKSRLFA